MASPIALPSAMARRRWLLALFLAPVFAVALVALVGGGLTLIKYVRAGTPRALDEEVSRLPPGTPYAEFEKRYGPSNRVFIDPDSISAWGPLKNPALLQSTELHLFFRRGSLPFYFICVYRDKKTGRVEHVTWTGM